MQSPLLRKTYFFDTGFIEFKGAMLPTCEVIFTASEKYKGKLAAEMNRLFTSIRESLWERVFLDLAALLAKTFAEMPAFNIPAEKLSFHLKELNNEIAGRICTAALTAYEGEDYPLALNLLGELVKILECCPAADRLILEYAREVAAKYSALLEPYNEALGRQVDDKAEDIFPGDKVKTYRAAKNGADIYQKLLYAAKKSPLLTRKKTVWFNLIKENKKNLDFVIYSGKK
jgi:hypothetical protein